MKKLYFLLFSAFAFTAAHSQLNPVSWSFTAVKVDDKKYEIHMKATMQNGWHLFSQSQPDDAVANPTAFKFNKNPLMEIDGKIKEVGNLQKFHDAKLDISANQYTNTVDFVQIVKIKGKVKTSLTGSVEYQTCDDKKCLPPKTINFSVLLQ